MYGRSLFFLTLCGIGVVGCVSDGDRIRDAVTTDSAGVSIVSNTNLDRALSWSLRQRLELGGEDDGPEAFFEVSRPLVSFDSDGSIYVLNRQAYQVVKFTANGEFLFAVGGEGGGPGEFLRPRSVAAAPNGKFYVYDSSKDRFVSFDGDGSAENEIAAGSAGFRFLALDDLFVTHHHPYFSDGSIEYLQLTEADDTLRIASTGLAVIRNFRYVSCGFPMGVTAAAIFAPELVWHGNMGGIAVNSEPAYVVNVFDAAGNPLRSVRRLNAARQATAELAEAWVRANPVRFGTSSGECIVNPEEVVEKREYAQYVPWISDVAYAPDGTLWVQRYALPPDTPLTDVFDATGVYVGTLEPAFPFPMAFLPDGDLLISVRDDLDVERLVVASLITR